MTWKAGVDVLSFGGTKNGLMGVEAVVLFDPRRAWEFELRRKRGGHLMSKHRYLAAQLEAYLDGDLWLDLARAANARAEALSCGIARLPGTRLLHPTQANMVFATWPRARYRALREGGAQYSFWPPDVNIDGDDDEMLPARLVCNWATTGADIAAFLDLRRRTRPRRRSDMKQCVRQRNTGVECTRRRLAGQGKRRATGGAACAKHSCIKPRFKALAIGQISKPRFRLL